MSSFPWGLGVGCVLVGLLGVGVLGRFWGRRRWWLYVLRVLGEGAWMVAVAVAVWLAV